MKTPALSAAASGLLRALIARSGAARENFFLTRYRSTDWSSLTFIGERHEMEIAATGQDALKAADRTTENLGEADFSIPGHIVADIAVASPLERHQDGSVRFHIEALTVAE